MDELENKKAKLISLKKKIEKMSDNETKLLMIDGYVALLEYLKECEDMSISEYQKHDLEMEDVKKYYGKIEKNTLKKLDDLYNVAPYLKDIFQRLITEYQKEDFCSYESYNYHKINVDFISDELISFFKYLGNDVYKLYKKMCVDENVSMIREFDYSGVSFNSLPVDSPTIIVEDSEEFLDFYFTIAHEMGHCYQFYLQRNQRDYSSFNFFNEVTSILFEKLFRNYLAKKQIYLDDLAKNDLSDHIYFLNEISGCKVLCDAIINNHIKHIDAFDLHYDMDIPEETLLTDMVKDCGYIMPNKIDLSLTTFQYAIGAIIASYFERLINDDFDKGFREFKDFICTVNYLSVDEVFNKYLDMNLIQNKIKKFMKSYR